MENTTPESAELIALLKDAQEAHEIAIRLIAERLHQEAHDHDWCAEYDEMIELINSSLHIKMPKRGREYHISHTFTIDVGCNIKAPSEREAIELFFERWDTEPTLTGVGGWYVASKHYANDKDNVRAFPV